MKLTEHNMRTSVLSSFHFLSNVYRSTDKVIIQKEHTVLYRSWSSRAGFFIGKWNPAWDQSNQWGMQIPRHYDISILPLCRQSTSVEVKNSLMIVTAVGDLREKKQAIDRSKSVRRPCKLTQCDHTLRHNYWSSHACTQRYFDHHVDHSLLDCLSVWKINDDGGNGLSWHILKLLTCRPTSYLA